MPGPRAARPERGAPEETFIDLYATLATAPAIGCSLLGQAELDRLDSWLEPSEHALLIAARGRYSFKGSGYVRGGVFSIASISSRETAVCASATASTGGWAP